MENMDLWSLSDELSILNAVYLMIGEDPSDYPYFVMKDFDHAIPNGFRPAFDAMTSAIKSGRLKATICHNVYIADKDIYGITYPSINQSSIEAIFQGKEQEETVNVDLEPNWSKSTVAVDDLKQWLKSKGVTTGFFFPDADFSSQADFDTSAINAPELKIAFETWRKLQDKNNWPDSYRGEKGTERVSTPKQAILGWLQQNHTDLANEAVDRISKVVDWDRSGKKYK